MSPSSETTAGAQRDRDKDLRELARHSGLNLAGSVVAAGLHFVLPILVTRNLTQGEAGTFFQGIALFTLLFTIGTFGADTGLLRFLPRAIAQRSADDVRATLRISLGPPLVLAVVLAVALALSADAVGGLVTGDDSRLASTFADMVRLLSLMLPVAVVYLLGLAASRGLGAIMPLVVIEKLGRGSVQVAACAAVLAVTNSVLLLTLAWVAPYAVALVILTVWLVDRVRKVQRWIRRAGGEASSTGEHLTRDFWTFYAPRALSRGFSVALQRIDILIVGALSGPADAALYMAATRFPILGLMFVQAIQQVMAPRISEFLTLGARDRAITLYQTTMAWLILVSWPIYMTSVFFAPFLLHVFGPEYSGAAPAVVMLCLAMLVATACGPVDSVLLMGGRSGLSLLNTGLALVVMVGLDFLLIPDFGVTGAAVGWTAGILVNNLLPLWQVHRTLHMHPLGTAAKYAIGLTLGSAVVVAVSALLGGQTLPALIAGVLLSGSILVAGLRKWREPLEIAAMAGAMRKRRSKSRPSPSASE